MRNVYSDFKQKRGEAISIEMSMKREAYRSLAERQFTEEYTKNQYGDISVEEIFCEYGFINYRQHEVIDSSGLTNSIYNYIDLRELAEYIVKTQSDN